MGWLGTVLNAVSSKFQKTVPQARHSSVDGSSGMRQQPAVLP
jgi:hypothetical protein